MRPRDGSREVTLTAWAYDQLATTYANRWGNVSPIRVRATRQRFVRHLHPGELILDLGCGPGRDAAAFLDMGLRVVAVDVSVGMAREAQRRIPEVITADMRNLPLKEGTAAGIWMAASFLHIPKRHAVQVLAECGRALKTSGVVYLTIKRGTGERWMSLDSGPQRFFAFYCEPELDDLIGGSGFSILDGWLTPDRSGGMPWINRLLFKEAGRTDL